MLNLDCYKDIIGITNIDCPCEQENRPENYNISNSGYYLMDLPIYSLLKGLDNCIDGDLWDLAVNAIKQAKIRFIGDTNAILLNPNIKNAKKLKRKTYIGGIGEITARDFIEIPEKYAGIRIKPANIKGGSLCIKGIGALFSDTTIKTIWVFNNLNELIDTVIINTDSNNHIENPVNIELPLSHKYTNDLEYFIIYEVDDNAAKKNKINCGCGRFTPFFNKDNPYYASNKESGGNGWANWFMIGGFVCDDLISFNAAPKVTNNILNGLTLDVETKCLIGQVICKDVLNFENNPLALTIAHAIQKKAAILLSDKLLLQTNINKYSMLSGEELYDYRDEWGLEYDQSINYVVENANINDNDCLTCAPKYGLKREQILR